jgi:penicillin amidase
MAEPALSTPPAPAPVPTLPRPRSRAGRIARRLALGLLVLLAVLLLAGLATGLWLRSEVRASLPQVAGERAVAGLAAPVRVERDALGVPTVRGANRNDVARALGFLHAQDRFFQMDLMRRQGAGELSELFGGAALDVDKEYRVHRFRHRARRLLAGTSAPERALLESYAAGVNAGLAALGAHPFEYVLLRTPPAPWRAEDSVLVIYAMYFELQHTGGREASLGLMADLLPPQLAAFLAPPGTEWDAPLSGAPFAQPPVPGPEVLDLRTAPPPALPKAAARSRSPFEAPVDEETLTRAAVGSNNWAVAGTHTADGRALLANDMHLGHGVPNVWYRASLAWPAPGGERRITGVTLPGTPAVVVGSNGHVAWGFTNSYGDWNDLVVLEMDPRQPGVYRTPAGPRRLQKVSEPIRLKGGREVAFEVEESIWGPVIDRDHQGRPRALVWTAHFPVAANLRMTALEGARTLEEALHAAQLSGTPAQNFVVADASGRIGWTIMGRIPRRVGFDGRVPTSWADGTRRWDGWLTPAEAPRIVDPPTGRLWTANARTMEGEALALLGDGGYALGARARQIRDDLFALDKATAEDLLAVQLDDRALFLARWRELLLQTLRSPAASAPRYQELRRLVETTWTGRASLDSVAYRATRAFHIEVGEHVYGPLTWRCRQADERFGGFQPEQDEGPMWALVTARPAHLLDPRFRTWDELLLASVDGVLERFARFGDDLSQRTWGERNRVRPQHPLSQAVPALGRWLDMPMRQLPGDLDMPRVQAPGFGASERLVVSPGQEGKGFFHMPVGQSGHPMSPHYSDGHAAWAEGRPTPFLPGPAVHTLTLVPGAAAAR